MKVIVALVFCAVMISGLFTLSGFKPKIEQPKPKKVKIDTVASFMFLIQDNELYIVGGYDKTVFNDPCDIYEIVARKYFRECVLPPDTTGSHKTKRL